MFYTLETQGRESLRLPLLPTSLQFSAHHLAMSPWSEGLMPACHLGYRGLIPLKVFDLAKS